MADKPERIDDIKQPDKVSPAASSRPLLVTNRPTLLSDPMMAPPSGNEKPADNGEMQLAHTAKTINPTDTALAPAKPETSETGQPANDDAAEKPATDSLTTENSVEPKATTALKVPNTPDMPVSADSDDEDEASSRDTEAAISAEEAAHAEAKSKREEELEGLIVNGKYAVPINAVQRKRSRTNTLVLSLLAVLLAVALFDAIADVGVVKLPASIPHTHFFSAK